MKKNQNRIYVFDVDGTLTPSRQKMDPDFKKWFLKFFKKREFVLVSGSDYKKLQEQVGDDLLMAAKMVFPCSGNNVWIQGREVYKSDWQPSTELLEDLHRALTDNTYEIKTGNHIEVRTGLVNFSFVGRNANLEQRKAYYEWDREHSERLWLCLNLRKKYPNLTFEIGGEISLDIYPNGCDKSQILSYLLEYDISFFGDGIEPGKNDYSLAKRLYGNSSSYPVTCWQDTKQFLEDIKKA